MSLVDKFYPGSEDARLFKGVAKKVMRPEKCTREEEP
jgi:hypothetical protein